MKTKKIPYYFLLFLLTGGASLIIGFLSFGGMFALWPLLPLAFGSLVLSIAYEGEIYFQNIKGALDKLFKRNHTENRLANEFLLNNFPDTKDEQCPQFFKDYKAQLKLLHKLEHKRLKKESQAKKEDILKTIKTMEKWFALQVFSIDSANKSLSVYEDQLRKWLTKEAKKQLIKNRDTSYTMYLLMGIFSGVSAFFMAFATTFLLSGAIELIPALAFIPAVALPFIIIPMALVAGAAYGLLIYNTITDMYNNDTIRNSWNRIRANFVDEECHVMRAIPENLQKYKNSYIFLKEKEELYYITETGEKKKETIKKTLKKVLHDTEEGDTLTFKDGTIFNGILMATLSAVLFALAGALTLLTAGTWWSVALSARPVFEWMAKLPVWMVGILTPLFTGLSTLFFDIQNTSETLEIIDEELRAEVNIFQRAINELSESFEKLKKRENWLQILNPFRILLALTIAPLLIVLFLGHLISIGVTTDRVPGFSEFWMTFWGILSESFQDAHYFMNHEHKHMEASEGHHEKHAHHHEHKHSQHTDFNDILKERLGTKHSHSHDVNLPARLLKLLFTPLYFLAACWAWITSKLNNQPMDFDIAWEQQHGLEEAQTVQLPEQDLSEWNFERAIYKIQRYKEKQLYNPGMFAKPEMAKEKAKKLTQLQDKLRAHDQSSPLKKQIQAAAADPFYDEHRFFSSGPTASREFLVELQNVF